MLSRRLPGLLASCLLGWSIALVAGAARGGEAAPVLAAPARPNGVQLWTCGAPDR